MFRYQCKTTRQFTLKKNFKQKRLGIVTEQLVIKVHC